MAGTHTPRHRQPNLFTRASRSLFSDIPSYGTVTIVYMILALIVVQLGAVWALGVKVERAAERVRDERPTIRTVPVPGPTVTVTKRAYRSRGGGAPR